jgi:hypothetical protein
MIAAAQRFEVEGWCPGAQRLMPGGGDGLLVRFRPRETALSSAPRRGHSLALGTIAHHPIPEAAE